MDAIASVHRIIMFQNWNEFVVRGASMKKSYVLREPRTCTMDTRDSV